MLVNAGGTFAPGFWDLSHWQRRIKYLCPGFVVEEMSTPGAAGTQDDAQLISPISKKSSWFEVLPRDGV